MGTKFIPNSDIDFNTMAATFARTIAEVPARYAVTQEESDALTLAVKRYTDALVPCRHSSERSPAVTRIKSDARAEAERMIRRLATLIRANDAIAPLAKFALGLRERTTKPKLQTCPQVAPRLQFARALHEGGGGTPMHELKFSTIDYKSKPAGAVRLELFVDLVPPDEPIPAHPGANTGGRPWYLRSFTRSPIVLIPPMARVPMRVVYWGRWADSTGNVGPFSATAVGWIEGGSHHLMSPPTPGPQPKITVIDDVPSEASENRQTIYRVALIEAHCQSLIPQTVAPQLEGPVETEAA